MYNCTVYIQDFRVHFTVFSSAIFLENDSYLHLLLDIFNKILQ